MKGYRWGISVALLAFTLSGWGVAAQGEDLKIDAGDGIVWLQDQKHYYADGRVRIIRGNTTTWGDRAWAYYDDNPEVITLIKLQGNIRFLQKSLQIEGDSAQIIPEKESVTVKGEEPRLTQEDLVVTAHDFLRYVGDKQRIYAQGQALLIQGAQRVASERMEGILKRNQENTLILDHAFFWDNVRADDGNTDPQQRLFIEGEEGTYQASEGWVRVCGDSRVLRGGDVLKGDCAHYEMESKNFQFINNLSLLAPIPTPPPFEEEQLQKTPAPKPTQKRTRLRLKTKG